MQTTSHNQGGTKPGRRGPSTLELFCVLLLAGIAATWGYSRYAARGASATAGGGTDPAAAASDASVRVKAAGAATGDIFAEAMRAEADAKGAGEGRALSRSSAPDVSGGATGDDAAAAAGAPPGAFVPDAIGLKRTRKGGSETAKAGRGEGEKSSGDGAAGPGTSGFAPGVDRLRAALASGESTASIRDNDIAKFKEPDIQESLKILEGMPWGPETSRLFQNVIAQWGKVNPAEAMGYAMSLDSHRTRNSAVASVLDSWAKADPSSAFSWYAQQAQQNPGAVSWATGALFKNLAKADPSAALVNTWRLEDAGLKRTALQSVVDTMTRSGQGDQLVGLHRSMSEGADRNMLADLLVQSWTPYQPERAASWAMALDDPLARNRAVDRVVGSWSADQPSKAADWVAALPPGDVRSKEMGTVVQSWARDNVVEAAEWLRRFPPSADMDPAFQNMSVAISINDPATAMVWAQNVTDPKARQATMTRVASKWMERDPASAQQFIVGSGLPANVIQKLLGQPVEKIRVPKEKKTRT